MKASRLKVALLGSQGRMGQQVRTLLDGEYSSRAELTVAATRETALEQILAADVVVDFSSAAAVAELGRKATHQPRAHLPCFVVGSTGFSAADTQGLEALARHTPVLVASNFSLGVQTLAHVLTQIAPLLKSWGFSSQITETHHVHKKDAPSGTALTLARAMAPQDFARIPIQSIREGEVIGEHEVIFSGAAEELRLLHRATDRSIFARGALDVALWMHARRSSQSLPSGRVLTMREYFSEQAKLVAENPGQSL